MRYSISKKCFYPEQFNYPEVPNDCVDASYEEYQKCLGSLKGNQEHDFIGGKFVAVDRPVKPAKPVTNDEIKKQRAMAYKMESDPLYFEYVRGEITIDLWHNKIAEIKARLPYNDEGTNNTI